MLIIDRAEQELHKTKEERDRVLREKEIQIEILNMKVNSMSGQYEYLFNVSPCTLYTFIANCVTVYKKFMILQINLLIRHESKF